MAEAAAAEAAAAEAAAAKVAAAEALAACAAPGIRLCCRDSTGLSVSSTALALAAASRSCQESSPTNCGSSSSSSKQVGQCRFPAAKMEATAIPAILTRRMQAVH